MRELIDIVYRSDVTSPEVGGKFQFVIAAAAPLHHWYYFHNYKKILCTMTAVASKADRSASKAEKDKSTKTRAGAAPAAAEEKSIKTKAGAGAAAPADALSASATSGGSSSKSATKQQSEKQSDNDPEDNVTSGGDVDTDLPQVSSSSSLFKRNLSSPSPAPGTTAQDVQPYARGSVIEVLYIIKKDSSEDWWSESSSSEEDIEKTDEEGVHQHHKSVRLCDVIDRAPVETPLKNNTNNGGIIQWRYYVHYRDFNRRMDEWVGCDRIVSPPSVGNAKARAMKKEEERLKRKQLRKEEKSAAQQEAMDMAGPRGRRRHSTAPADPLNDAEAAGTRRTRLSRRKSTNLDDDATVVAGNQGEEEAYTVEDSKTNKSTKKEEGAHLPTDSVTTQTVGDHVVATVKAQELDEHEGLDEASLREHEEVTKVKNVAFVEIGQFQMETWYFSPIPKELLSPGGFIEVLFVCEFTFRLFARKVELQRFQARLPTPKRHPPGNEIYRSGNLSMFEVDGLEEKIYCQNLCYLAKLFLDHKTLYFDVDPFLFYVLCEVDDRGFHPVGYYSKEKYSDVGYNLACILTFPSHQRKGYGRFLIAFSYELSKKEEKVGSPEKPMSDLGQQAYKPYWASTIVDFLLHESDESSLSIMDASKKTSIMAEDIVFTLNQLGILKIINGVYFIAAEKSLLERLAKKYPVKEPRVDPTKLHWTPFLTDIKRDKFSIHSKKPSVEAEESRGTGGF
jgi:histone acetyltransferase MYST1